jgi:hypothetical protein
VLKDNSYLLNYFQTYSNARSIYYEGTNTTHIFNIILTYETYKHVKNRTSYAWGGFFKLELTLVSLAPCSFKSLK